MVNADSCRVTVPEVIPNQTVVFGCDIPAGRWAVRCARGDVQTIYSVADELESPPMVALIRALTTPVEPRHLGPGVTTFEALCASAPLRLDDGFLAETSTELSGVFSGLIRLQRRSSRDRSLRSVDAYRGYEFP
jgi:hypothetical protein